MDSKPKRRRQLKTLQEIEEMDDRMLEFSESPEGQKLVQEILEQSSLPPQPEPPKEQ